METVTVVNPDSPEAKTGPDEHLQKGKTLYAADVPPVTPPNSDIDGTDQEARVAELPLPGRKVIFDTGAPIKHGKLDSNAEGSPKGTVVLYDGDGSSQGGLSVMVLAGMRRPWMQGSTNKRTRRGGVGVGIGGLKRDAQGTNLPPRANGQ